jgi:uncharacterized protein YndB with AHSA1/START domain
MKTTEKLQTTFDKDVTNKKMLITREFAGDVKNVWNAWTQPRLLDQWWAPKPWKTETKSQDFREGGSWLYAMVGPDGTRHWAKLEYKTINPNKSLESVDAFCDENGKTNTEFPGMNWRTVFNTSSVGTKVEIEITYNSVADMEKMIEMGFKEGFAMAHDNLDELLAGKH